MKKYRIPVSWTVDLILEIEAADLEDAIEEAISKQVPEEEAVFRTGSFLIHEEDMQVEIPAVPAHYVDVDKDAGGDHE